MNSPHYYGGDTQLTWVFKARDNLARVLVNLTSNSAVVSLLKSSALGALLHIAVTRGLTLYWNLLAKGAQYVSRQQEFRCDELACYVAGSENLEQGLCSVQRAVAGCTQYWKQVGAAIADGVRPPLADGFARFMETPEIAAAAEAYTLAQVIEQERGIDRIHIRP